MFVSRARLPHGSAAERCPVTGPGRLSYRRAAELFNTATRDLDPQGRGWPLRDLRRARASVASPPNGFPAQSQDWTDIRKNVRL